MARIQAGWVLGALAAAAVAGPAAAQQPQQPAGIEIGARGWRSHLSFDAEVDKNYIPGTSFDENTLGQDSSKLIPVPYARLGGLGQYLIADYVQASYDGSATLTADLTVSGTRFPAGTRVESELDLKLISGYYNYGLTDPQGSFQAGVLAGVKYFRVEADVESGAGGASMRLTAPAPVVGTLFRMTLFEGLEINAQIDGLQLPESILGMKAYVLEGFGEVVLKMGYLSAGAGYHYLKAEFSANRGDDDEIEFGMLMRGPYAVVALIF